MPFTYLPKPNLTYLNILFCSNCDGPRACYGLCCVLCVFVLQVLRWAELNLMSNWEHLASAPTLLKAACPNASVAGPLCHHHLLFVVLPSLDLTLTTCTSYFSLQPCTSIHH